MNKIEILDSTLRDGAQGENVSFSVRDKLNIVTTLDTFGVTYIEAGNPGSNPKDIEFFKEALTLNLSNSKLCAFGSTRRKLISISEDAGCLALLSAMTPSVSIFGKSWALHAEKILCVSKEENLKMIRDTVAFFHHHNREVIFDAEHFFDGFKDDSEYAISVLNVAVLAGAQVIVLCDTNGGTMPDTIRSVTEFIVKRFPTVRIGIHCHNDIGCAVANSLLAVSAGAKHVQGTFIGIGERCGNADLASIIPTLQLKLGYCCTEKDLSSLTEATMRIYDIANLIPPTDRPYTGVSAFAHKGGMHIDGVEKYPRSFEHIDPKSVGNHRRYLMSEMSGRGAILNKLSTIAPELKKSSPETELIVAKLKELEHDGYQFESADASFELTVLELLGRFKPSFSLQMYRTSGEFPSPDGKSPAWAVVKIEVNGKTETTASFGNGPVNALDLALRKGLVAFYPEVATIRLTDYKVRVLSGDAATGSKVRVLIENTDGRHIWTTTGVSADIIAASWRALRDSIEYYLLTNKLS
ncbi:MAG: citramalate synthase [Christensenellaceae bacterium]|jgi:2-isopropylmalate synthase|nr:citramalate synthase [Christensenellaceae bacterium]